MVDTMSKEQAAATEVFDATVEALKVGLAGDDPHPNMVNAALRFLEKYGDDVLLPVPGSKAGTDSFDVPFANR